MKKVNLLPKEHGVCHQNKRKQLPIIVLSCSAHQTLTNNASIPMGQGGQRGKLGTEVANVKPFQHSTE